MARPLRVQFSGGVYYLTLRANSRQALFRDDSDRRRFLQLLGRYRDQFSVKFFAFLLTTRQVDLLLETPRANLSKIMQCLGTSYVSYFNRRHKRTGTLFDGRFRSHLVQRPTGLSEAARFIHLCRLKSGLKQRRCDPWCSYRVYIGKGATDLIDTGPVLSQFGEDARAQRRGYQQFVENGGVSKGLGVSSFRSSSIVCSSRLAGDGGERAEQIARRIMHEVSASLDAQEFASPHQRNRRAVARHLTMYLVRRHTDLSLNAIGEMLGVKPSAVAQGICNIQRLLKRGEVSDRVKAVVEIVPRMVGDSYPEPFQDQQVPVGY